MHLCNTSPAQKHSILLNVIMKKSELHEPLGLTPMITGAKLRECKTYRGMKHYIHTTHSYACTRCNYTARVADHQRKRRVCMQDYDVTHWLVTTREWAAQHWSLESAKQRKAYKLLNCSYLF